MTADVPLYILGSSGHAREIAAYARELYPGRPVFFVDDKGCGVPCISVHEYWERVEKDGGESIIGSGRCDTRRRMAAQIRLPLATVVHPSATVMGCIAPGCVVAPGAVIAPGANVGEHVLVNYNATVGHDCAIGPLSVVGPTVAIGGWCQLGEAVYVGAGALIRERLTVGNDAVIAMGAVVTKDVPAGAVAVGVPARFRQRSQCEGRWLR
jgi:sugar O-acyltransferase (sialic acid O-acetyltransferase NeuD family)